MAKVLQKLKVVDIFTIVSFVNIVAVYIALFITNGQFLSEIVWDARHDLFVDFTLCEGDHLGQVSYGFYYILGRFIPDGVIEDSLVDRWAELFCVIFLVTCVVTIVLISREYLEESIGKTLLFSWAFVMSGPFAFACIKAGNTLYVSLTALLAAMYLREKDSPICKEAALICIAFATDLKLAPAIFGLLYIKEKRYKEAVRLALYGVLFVIAPPLLFGGLDRYIGVITEHSGLVKPRPETIIGVIIEITTVLGLSNSIGLILGKICSYVYLAVCVGLLFLHKNSWKTLCLISSILIVFLNMSYPYTLCYLLIPLLYFIREEKDTVDVKNILYAVLFALTFTVYPFLRIDWPTATFITNYFFLYILLFYLIIDVAREVVQSKR